jgi:hypothetical protein
MAASVKTRKTSPSDLTSRAPVSQQESANVTGTLGAAAAETLYKAIETQAKAVVQVLVKAETSLKGHLGDILRLSDEDHVAYRAALEKHVNEIGVAAKNAGLDVTKYRQSDKTVNYIYVSLSEWKRLYLAVQAGFLANDPAWKDMPWGEIKKGASDYLKASAAKAEQARLREQAVKITADLADPKMPALARKKAEASLAMVNVQMEEAAVQVNPAKKSEAKPKSLIELIEGLVKGRPIAEVETAFAWLGSYIVGVYKPGERVVNTAKQAVAAAKAEADKTGAPAPTINADKPASNDTQERAAASNATTKAKARRARKSAK